MESQPTLVVVFRFRSTLDGFGRVPLDEYQNYLRTHRHSWENILCLKSCGHHEQHASNKEISTSLWNAKQADTTYSATRARIPISVILELCRMVSVDGAVCCMVFSLY